MKSPEVKKAFGEAVRFNRTRLGLSQELLAERSNLHRTYISEVERGRRNICLMNISRLAVALGVPISALFPPESAPQNGQETSSLSKSTDLLPQ